MRILICTSFDLDKACAGLNKMNKLIDSLNLYGIESYLCGFSEKAYEFTNKKYFVKNHKIFFKLSNKKFRHSKSLSINVNAASSYQNYLNSLLKEFPVDLIIIYSTFSTFIEPLTEISRKNNIKVTAYVGELFGFSIKYLLNGVLFMQYKAYLHSFKLLDGLICASPSWKSYADKINKKSVLLPTYIESKESYKHKNKFKENFRIVMMTNFSRREKPLVILNAISKLETINENVELFIIGNKPKYTLINFRSYFLRLKISKIRNIHFTGFIQDEERDNLLSSSDCFILLRDPTLESKFLFPVRIGEYLSKKKPLILSDVIPFNIFFQHKKEVYFISKSNNPNELSKAILEIKNNSQLSKKISNDGYDYAERYFSLEYLGLNVFKFLNTII